MQRLEAVQTSHVTHVACGGWILWRWCPKTIYRTQYLTVEVPESRNITDCCKGYEQLGLYCVLRESREGLGREEGPLGCHQAGPSPLTPDFPHTEAHLQVVTVPNPTSDMWVGVEHMKRPSHPTPVTLCSCPCPGLRSLHPGS